MVEFQSLARYGESADAFKDRCIEVASGIDKTFHGKDLCDMSGARDRSPSEYTVYNVMLPRTYYPKWQGNIFEQRCQVCQYLGETGYVQNVMLTACLVQDIADQLQGGDMLADFDQVTRADLL